MTDTHARLLFAAARGARLQVKEYPGEWNHAVFIDFRQTEFWRIHPDDVLRQYGPLSTELRRMAQEPIPGPADVAIAHGDFGPPLHDYIYYSRLSPLARSLALLILAEALSFDGM